MRPDDIQVIGQELAIKWSDGSEDFLPLEKMRRACPCASCAGEQDIMGNVYKGPDTPLTPEAFHLVRFTTVGGYGIQPEWGDRHGSGIYDFKLLKRLASEAAD